jgi:hypothetical protein
MNGDFFEQWVNVDWPPEIATDCTSLADDADCIERHLPAKCPSCWEYQRRMDMYYSNRI